MSSHTISHCFPYGIVKSSSLCSTVGVRRRFLLTNLLSVHISCHMIPFFDVLTYSVSEIRKRREYDNVLLSLCTFLK